MSKAREEERKRKARIGYQVAMGLVNLVSQEIYSRFNAMLTANSIIIAIIGWALTSQRTLPPFLTILLPIMGLILCFLWFLFVNHGVYWQNLFREKARELEDQYFSDTFKLISHVVTETPRSPKVKSQIPRLVRWFPFYRTSSIVIIVFGIVYAVILLLQIISPPLTGFDP